MFGGDLAGNAIWKTLPFVKSGNVHRLPDGIWMFGGPKSTEQYIDAAVAGSHLLTQVTAPRPDVAGRRRQPVRRVRVAGVFVIACVAVVLLAAVHLTQGTSSVDAGDLLRLLVGQRHDDAANVLVASRLPRLLAGVLVGVALGVAGAGLQSLARNPLASPDTLAVNAGAYLRSSPRPRSGSRCRCCPPAGSPSSAGWPPRCWCWRCPPAGVRADPADPGRLGGRAGAGRRDHAAAAALREDTIGMFAWGNGSLVQTDLDAVTQMAPVVAVGIVGALLLAPKLDILALGDDTGRGARRARPADAAC